MLAFEMFLFTCLYTICWGLSKDYKFGVFGAIIIMVGMHVVGSVIVLIATYGDVVVIG